MKKEYKIEYTLNGKKDYAMFNAASEEEAKTQLLKYVPRAVVTSVVAGDEVDDDPAEDPATAATSKMAADGNALEQQVLDAMNGSNGGNIQIWNAILGQMTTQEREGLFNELVEDAKKNAGNDAKKLAGECLFLMNIFNKQKDITLRDIGKFWGMSHVGVLKTEQRAMKKVQDAIAKKGGTSYKKALTALAEAMKGC